MSILTQEHILCEIAKHFCLHDRIHRFALLSQRTAAIVMPNMDYITSSGIITRCMTRTRTAAYDGHLLCLRFAQKMGDSLTSDVCIDAASNGHLDCLRYAHEQGCAWDSYVCRVAMIHGHLNCLVYAIEKQCPFVPIGYVEAFRFVPTACVDYACKKKIIRFIPNS